MSGLYYCHRQEGDLLEQRYVSHQNLEFFGTGFQAPSTHAPRLCTYSTVNDQLGYNVNTQHSMEDPQDQFGVLLSAVMSSFTPAD